VSEIFLLDTSAILAFMEKEAGDERVKSILKNETVFIPWPALAEMFYITCRERGEDVAELRYAMLKRSGARLLWLANEAILVTAGKIKAFHPVSFADAIIAAYAVHSNAILVHKDPELEFLANQVEMEILPYK